MSDFQSWGRYPALTQRAIKIRWRDELATPPMGTFLPRGNGRSYGDTCLSNQGTLVDVRGLDRFLAFDPTTGVLRCEGGVLLGAVLDVFLRRGWCLPVLPGTQYVTVGGSIANDVHGKNHHRRGTFGHHVLGFELVRSDRGAVYCSPDTNTDLFRASIGGLGLTGVIAWADLQLMRIPATMVEVENSRFRSLGEVFDRSEAAEPGFEYIVAWIDCLNAEGRGVLTCGNFSSAGEARDRPSSKVRELSFAPSFSLVSKPLLRAFNLLYYHWPRAHLAKARLREYLFPLDSIGGWNRLYGPKGFVQHQCVIPPAYARDAILEMLKTISRARLGSFLAVLKVFGNVEARGLLSFPRPGVTLAIDFPLADTRTFEVLDTLDRIVLEAGGALYPAKDARMSAETFRASYPRWEQLERLRDPRIDSAFWNRVMVEA